MEPLVSEKDAFINFYSSDEREELKNVRRNFTTLELVATKVTPLFLNNLILIDVHLGPMKHSHRCGFNSIIDV